MLIQFIIFALIAGAFIYGAIKLAKRKGDWPPEL